MSRDLRSITEEIIASLRPSVESSVAELLVSTDGPWTLPVAPAGPGVDARPSGSSDAIAALDPEARAVLFRFRDALPAAVESAAALARTPDPDVVSRREAADVDVPEGPALAPRTDPATLLRDLRSLSLQQEGLPQGFSLLPSGTRAAEHRFGKYEILRLLGSGGMGDVYLARRIPRGPPVALKLLRRTNPVALERFLREARVTAELKHPSIVSILDVGVQDGTAYIVMEHVEGEPLSRKIEKAKEVPRQGSMASIFRFARCGNEDRGAASKERAGDSKAGLGHQTPLEIRRTLNFFEKVAKALHVAHERGLVHRDLKPRNIMVTEQGEPMILDFGLAQLESETAATLTPLGVSVGTLPYMSPEQCGAQEVDRRADVYSLGVILYECLTLSVPFQGPSRESHLRAILESKVPDPCRRNPALPRDLRVLLKKAIHRDRQLRHATAQDLADDLRRVRLGEPLTRWGRIARALRRWLS